MHSSRRRRLCFVDLRAAFFTGKVERAVDRVERSCFDLTVFLLGAEFRSAGGIETTIEDTGAIGTTRLPAIPKCRSWRGVGNASKSIAIDIVTVTTLKTFFDRIVASLKTFFDRNGSKNNIVGRVYTYVALIAFFGRS